MARQPNLKAIEEAMEDDPNPPNTAQEADTNLRIAPTPIDLARRDTERLVTNIADDTIMQLGQCKDELDGYMNALGEERDAIVKQIQKYADFSAKAIRAKITIAESLAKLRSELKE